MMKRLVVHTKYTKHCRSQRRRPVRVLGGIACWVSIEATKLFTKRQPTYVRRWNDIHWKGENAIYYDKHPQIRKAYNRVVQKVGFNFTMDKVDRWFMQDF